MNEALAPALDLLNTHTVPANLIEPGDSRYRVHPNGGGLVALTAHVGDHVFLDKHAVVRDRAIVVGAVRLFGYSVIEGNAIVADYCTLRGRSSVGGEAVVRGRVTLSHDARIDGTARVSGSVVVQHFGHVKQGSFAGTLTVT